MGDWGGLADWQIGRLRDWLAGLLRPAARPRLLTKPTSRMTQGARVTGDRPQADRQQWQSPEHAQPRQPPRHPRRLGP